MKNCACTMMCDAMGGILAFANCRRRASLVNKSGWPSKTRMLTASITLSSPGLESSTTGERPYWIVFTAITSAPSMILMVYQDRHSQFLSLK